MSALTFLQKDEWTMGNGQCPDCYGNAPGKWAPHPCVPTKDHEGHTGDCPRAAAIAELGGSPVYRAVSGERGTA